MIIMPPSRLALGLRFGESLDRFAEKLEVRRDIIVSQNLYVLGASVTFRVDEDENVTSIVLECIAD